MDHKDVSYFVFEEVVTKLESTIEKLWILCIILILLLVGTNAGWLYYEKSFEDVVMTQEAEIDTENGNAIVTNGGDIDYGTSESEANN